MRPPIIDDRELVRLLDKENMSQSAAARKLGVSRQAVSHRIIQLRGRATKVIASGKVQKFVDNKLDVVDQLYHLNQRAHQLLDELDNDHAMAVKLMAEIRSQLRLQIEIFSTLYSMQEAQKFQKIVLDVIGKVDPGVRNKIIQELNAQSAIRSAIKFA